MRKAVIALGVVLVGVFAVGTAGAKPHGGGGAPLDVPVAGTFTPAVGAETVRFSGTLTVDRFVEVDGQLALDGVLTADAAAPAEALLEPLSLTVTAVASLSVDAVTGDCLVEVGTASSLVQRDFLLFLEGTTFQLGAPGSGQEVCGVVKASDKDPGDQGAIAGALNKALGMS